MQRIKKLRFHTKLILGYSLIIVLILTALCLVFYSYAYQLVLQNAKTSYEQTAIVMRDTFESTIHEMQNILGKIQSSQDIIFQLRTMRDEESKIGNRFVYKMWLKRILLNAVGDNSNVYRLSVFNEKGDILSTGSHIYDYGEIRQVVLDCPWYGEFRSGARDEYLYYPHQDAWSDTFSTTVFSLVRPITYYGGLVGYVEAQCRKDLFDQITLEGESAQAPNRMIVLDGDHVFYANFNDPTGALTRHYLAEHESLIGNSKRAVNPLTGEVEMVVTLGGNANSRVVVAQQMNRITGNMGSFLITMYAIILMVLATSIGFFIILVRRMTVPLRHLKDSIDATRADTLSGVETPFSQRDNDEIALIERSFSSMQKRLRESINNEIRLQTLQTKARFETLQARINPHFLYNTLGIISGKCMEVDQYEVADMCNHMASTLRYSLSSPDAISTISEEIQHTRNYLIIMSKRFEHRLEYQFDEDARVADALIPKLCIQPLVENSILHGFENTLADVMRIRVESKLLPGDQWEVRIFDNGCGFGKEQIERINGTIARYKAQGMGAEETDDVSWGGMGILNTFIRIELFSQNKMEMRVANNNSGGACIIIRCPFVDRRKE